MKSTWTFGEVLRSLVLLLLALAALFPAYFSLVNSLKQWFVQFCGRYRGRSRSCCLGRHLRSPIPTSPARREGQKTPCLSQLG